MQLLSGLNEWVVKCDLCERFTSGPIRAAGANQQETDAYKFGFRHVQIARSLANEVLEFGGWLILPDLGIDVCPSCRRQPSEQIAQAIADKVRARVLHVLEPDTLVIQPEDSDGR